MRIRGRALTTLCAAAVALVAPAAAHATLVYQSGTAAPNVFRANDNGSGKRFLAPGISPLISPDGRTVIYGNRPSSATPELRAISTSGGFSRTLLRPWRSGATIAWSPDSRKVVAVTGPEVGRQRLVLIDVTTGSQRTLANGFFFGASFSPTSDRVVWGQANSDFSPFAQTNLLTASVFGGPPRFLTTDGHSEFPVWGPTRIAFTRWTRPTGPRRDQDALKFNIWLVRPNGSGLRQLTRDRPAFLLSGLTPTAWSANATRLLAQFGGQDTTFAVTVNPFTGRERVVTNPNRSLVGTALSRDGSTILGFTGGADGGPGQRVVTTPYLGGPLRVLANNASSPSWNR